MAEKRAEAGDQREIAIEQGRRHQHRDGALEHVAQKRRGRKRLAAGAQHIGGADIAGADGAEVLRARKPRQDDAERDRAAQIAEHQRGD